MSGYLEIIFILIDESAPPWDTGIIHLVESRGVSLNIKKGSAVDGVEPFDAENIPIAADNRDRSDC